MEVQSLGFRTDLMLRRLAGSDVSDRGDHVVVRTPANPTFYWGNFLLVGGPLADGDAARWLTSFAAEFPDAEHVAIGVDGTDGETGPAESFTDGGLALEVSIVLVADEVAQPFRVDPDAELRPVETDAEWAQVVDMRARVAGDADDAGHRTFLTRRAEELRSWTAAGHGTYVGAFVDDRLVAGLGLFTDGSGVARYQNVETHPDFRRRGLAAGLLCLAADEVAARHPVESYVIVADPGYVAIDLYRRMDFRDAERQVQWQLPAPT